ncbi:MAG TPA: hypothetical protein VFJ43_06830 [Bacteroidia bacterium]|nr:hypothetical protein [Bacteroidia bacterium]
MTGKSNTISQCFFDFCEDQGLEYFLGTAIDILIHHHITSAFYPYGQDKQRALIFIQQVSEQAHTGKWQYKPAPRKINVAKFCVEHRCDGFITEAIILLCQFNALDGKDNAHYIFLLTKAKKQIQISVNGNTDGETVGG